VSREPQYTEIRQGWVVPGTVRRIVDGDTLEIDLDLGWGVSYRKATVRLVGINCPERNTPAGLAASARAEQLLPPGTPVQVMSHKRDKYGRVLATVIWQQSDGEVPRRFDLSQMLLSEGHAEAFMVEKPPPASL
jgi:micrococcal nuclease